MSQRADIATAEDERPSRDLPLARKELLSVAFVALLALVVRAILIPAHGHVTDVATFESWMGTLIKVGPKQFYSTASFVDYPPGYMLVLWIVGAIYHVTLAYGDFTGDAMRAFVKLPAIVADIGIGYLTYLIARRTWPIAGAIVAMAVFALNPVSWLVSAYWGQADSVAAVFLVWSLYLAVTRRFEVAWVALAFAVLIKPQPLVIAPLLLIWQIRAQGLTWRLALVPLLGALVAYFGSLPFAPVNDPLGVIRWLLDRYQTGVSVYPYNSVNALNLYSINRDFFQSDTQPISFFGAALGPQYLWGEGIFIALLAATGWRLWRVLGSTDDADVRETTFYSACFIVALGLFMVVTRQHERYLFTALALAPLLWNASPVMRLATVILSATFTYNLFYALEYLAAPSQDLHPLVVHPLSLLNFVTLVLVAGAFLIDEVGVWSNERLGALFSPGEPGAAAAGVPARRGPNPFEGLAAMTPRDWAIAGVLMIGTAVLLFWNVTMPAERYFDEIYYARAAQEYIHHQSLYEWTHPPLTKLIDALGAWVFGPPNGPYGDPIGARMANCVMGAITVPLIYAFAKRLFSSTAASIVAVVLLVSSGYFYVQARIATPEISVAFFSLLTLYCFYRYWTASQIVKTDEAKVEYPQLRTALAAAGVVFVLVVFIYAQVAVYDAQAWKATVVPYALALVVFGAAIAYFGAASVRASRACKAVIYPDGSYVSGSDVVFPSGESKPLRSMTSKDGTASVTWQSDGVRNSDGGDRVTWRADGTIDGVLGGQPVLDRQQWALWLALSSASLACFISSKWNGLFGLAALWSVAGLVHLQQFFTRSASRSGSAPRRFAWGNPIGMRLPLYFAASILGILVIYVLTYVPNWAGAINTGTASIGQGGFAGLLSLQYQMYHYHATLTATHLYSSKWWTWPLELRPVQYYYKAISGATPPDQIVSEIVSLANPSVWWAGIVTVPWAGVLAWRERHRGMLLLIAAYLWLWLPWAASPRIDFMYNFFPNLSVICLCTTYVAVRMYRRACMTDEVTRRWAAVGIGAYLAVCVLMFAYFLPVLSGAHIPWTVWISRMWIQGPIEHGWI